MDSKKQNEIPPLLEIIALLPVRIMEHLLRIFNDSKSQDRSDEFYLNLGQAIQSAIRTGSLSRREMLQLGALLSSSGILSMLFPRTTQAGGVLPFGFWGAGARQKAASLQTYVDDVFSPLIYTGNGTGQAINAGIQLGDGISDDPYWNNVSLLLHGDGVNGSTSFIDSSNYHATVTPTGNAQISTAAMKYGSGSMYFDGSEDRLTINSSSVLNFTDDLTIECWFYCLGYRTTYNAYYNYIFSAGVQSYPRMYAAVIYNGTLSCEISSSTQITSFVTSSAIALNQWHHLAIVRSGSTVKAYLNGTQFGTAQTLSGSVSFSTFLVGTSPWWPSQENWQGYIDDLRVTRGVARYTGGFTPPSSAFPDSTTSTAVTGQGGLVWIKNRDNVERHYFMDTLRGDNKFLNSDKIDAERTGALYTATSGAFFSKGFSVTTNSSINSGQDELNYNGRSYVSWVFRKASRFFDVVIYTGNGTSGRTINHSLGIAPGMIVVKRRDAASATGWAVWHRSAAGDLWLNLTNAQAGSFSQVTAATSTSFTLGSGADVNASGGTYVAYIYAHDPASYGIIQCGAFSASSAVSVSLGWEPQFLLWKNVAGSNQWGIADTMRGLTANGNYNLLVPNSTAIESSSNDVTLSSTGFTWNTPVAGSSYIYMAIRKSNKPPTTGSQIFVPTTYVSAGASNNITTQMPVDLVFTMNRDTVGDFNWYASSRLTGFSSLSLNAISAEITTYAASFVSNTGYTESLNYATGRRLLSYAFRRAPGVLDLVTYTGDGSINRLISHNLGMFPELLIVKRRGTTGDWWVDCDLAGLGKVLYLNRNNPAFSYTAFGTHTANQIQLETVMNNDTNYTGATYMAYLFASKTGISKIGSYTGNGSSTPGQSINCDFTAGARFVLIKRTDLAGDWYAWDSARGIIASANDPHLSLNSTSTEVTTDDSIDPATSGFIVKQSTATNINVSGATYIFVALS